MIAGVGGDVKKKHNSRYVFALQPTRYRVNGNKNGDVMALKGHKKIFKLGSVRLLARHFRL
jgi:hypothetical protein